MSSRFIIGDTRKVLAAMPDASVDLVITSPPFLALRSYLPADHPDKHLEIGSEQTPGEFLDTMLDVVEDCARVLTAHGSLVFELGDTYASPGGTTDNREDSLGGNDFAPRSRASGGEGWPLDKSLCMIPSSFAWALSYGRNPWTGRETPQWRVRNLIAWCRPNPPVGALGDKFRPGTSYLTIACKSRTRWFDLDAVRVAGSDNAHARTARGVDVQQTTGKSADDERRGGNWSTLATQHLNASAPPLDWWEIPTQPYAGAHYATFPERLVVRPIEAMCPREVCNVCGEPRRRITETAAWPDDERYRDPERLADTGGGRHGERAASSTTIGWTDCGHGNYRRGIVLDPFAGSGTTLAVAEGLARDSVGIDLDARNAELAARRCGMFLTIEGPNE